MLFISAAGAKILGYIASLHSYIADQLNALTAVTTAVASGILTGYAGTRARHRNPARSASREGGARGCALSARKAATVPRAVGSYRPPII